MKMWEPSRRTFSIAIVLVTFSSCFTARAQSTTNEFAVLVDVLGTYGRKISTQSEAAQKFFDQGLRLTFGYYFPEAIASFQEARRHDPEHPMIYWGMALAMGPNPNSRFLAFPDDPLARGEKSHQCSARPGK